MRRHAGVFLAVALSSAFGQSGGKRIEAPRFWNDHDLSDWATPVAGLNVRPGNYSEKEYYSAPAGELVRTNKHYVSHTVADYTAWLKLVETRFDLPSLTKRDAAQMDMTEFFDFTNIPWQTPPQPPTQPDNGPCYLDKLP